MRHTLFYRDGHLELRPMTYEDSEKYRKLRNQEQNRKWFLFSGIITEADQKKWYQTYLDTENDYMFSVYDKTGNFLGGAALYHAKDRQAEFGRLLIDKAAAGQGGFGYLTVCALCRLARESLHLSVLYLEVLRDNLPALKTYEKAGFLIKNREDTQQAAGGLFYMEKTL